MKLYYDVAISSVYLADAAGAPGFNACFLVKKELELVQQIKHGNWDAIHIVNCTLNMASAKAIYKLTSTVMITMDSQYEDLGNLNLAGSCAKNAEKTVPLPSDFSEKSDMFHIRNIGRMIEENENALRNEISDNYINKQRQIMNTGRLIDGSIDDEAKAKFKEELAAMQKKLGQNAD